MTEGPVTYEPTTDTLVVELRPGPGGNSADPLAGGEDAGDGLVIHYAPDGHPWAWEIEGASRRPDLLVKALRAIRAAHGLADVA